MRRPSRPPSYAEPRIDREVEEGVAYGPGTAVVHISLKVGTGMDNHSLHGYIVFLIAHCHPDPQHELPSNIGLLLNPCDEEPAWRCESRSGENA